MSSLVWLENHAGPLLFLPDALLTEWSGIDVPDFRSIAADFRWNLEEPRASDYDRACDIDDYVAPISVGHGEGLILNDEPRPTAWLPRESGGLFVRWEYAESAATLEAALRSIPHDLDWKAKGELGLVGSRHSIFNSAEPGAERVLPRLEIALAEGQYRVRWARYEVDHVTAVGLAELRRTSG